MCESHRGGASADADNYVRITLREEEEAIEEGRGSAAAINLLLQLLARTSRPTRTDIPSLCVVWSWGCVTPWKGNQLHKTRHESTTIHPSRPTTVARSLSVFAPMNYVLLNLSGSATASAPPSLAPHATR